MTLLLLRFNPTLVRLARFLFFRTYVLTPGFNPTLVRLAPAVVTLTGSPKKCFNPTLVRLALISNIRLTWGSGLFQSHPGSISTRGMEGPPPRA